MDKVMIYTSGYKKYRWGIGTATIFLLFYKFNLSIEINSRALLDRHRISLDQKHTYMIVHKYVKKDWKIF